MSLSPLPGEVTRPAFGWRPDNCYISYGLEYSKLLQEHIQRLGRHRVLAIISGSLAKNHPEELGRLESALQENLALKRIGMKSHTNLQEVLDVAMMARTAGVDILVTLGGGSITDAAKLISHTLSNASITNNDLKSLEPFLYRKGSQMTNFSPATIPIICIPTTLSGGEYSEVAVGIDPRDGIKKTFKDPSLVPSVVILDPALALLSPEKVWISSGVRAMDHCIEILCRTTSKDDTADEMAKKGLRLLARGLLKVKEHPRMESCRLETQLGANLAMDGFCKGLPFGASHGITHHMGSLGIMHGYTSSILCPAVMAYNLPANSDRQESVKSVLWSEPLVESALQSRNLTYATTGLSATLDSLFRELGMPRNLHEVGISIDENALESIAENSLENRWALTNPRPLLKKEQVLEILKAVV